LKIAQAITVFILSALVLGLTAGTVSAAMPKYVDHSKQAFHPFLTEDMKTKKPLTQYDAMIKKPKNKSKSAKYATTRSRGGTFGTAGVESGNRYAGRGPGMGLGYRINPPPAAPGPFAVPLWRIRRIS
jgi:hypothetical protein